MGDKIIDLSLLSVSHLYSGKWFRRPFEHCRRQAWRSYWESWWAWITFLFVLRGYRISGIKSLLEIYKWRAKFDSHNLLHCQKLHSPRGTHRGGHIAAVGVSCQPSQISAQSKPVVCLGDRKISCICRIGIAFPCDEYLSLSPVIVSIDQNGAQ